MADPQISVSVDTTSGSTEVDVAVYTDNANLFMSNIRSRSLPAGAEPRNFNKAFANFVDDDQTTDWRVRISMPDLTAFNDSPILAPLRNTNYSFVFPVVPTILMQSSANYSDLTPVHNNYAFPQYESSRVNDIQISGQIPVQSREDGKYWVAATHFLRSLTKMAYGNTSNKGAPPPVVKLNGYGNYVMNNIPCVITDFTVDLPNNVDYIEVPYGAQDAEGTYNNTTHVPTLSTITAVLKPIYSRDKVANFSLDDFVRGNLIDEGYL